MVEPIITVRPILLKAPLSTVCPVEIRDGTAGYELNYVYNGASLIWYANTPMKYKEIRRPAEKVVVADGFLAAHDLLDPFFEYSVCYYAILGKPFLG